MEATALSELATQSQLDLGLASVAMQQEEDDEDADLKRVAQ